MAGMLPLRHELVDGVFYGQLVVLDDRANALGLVTSNALRAQVGVKLK